MTTIDQLNYQNTLTVSDLLTIYSASNGDARKTSIYNMAVFLQTLITVTDSKISQYSAPLTGANVNVTDSSSSIWLILTPAALIAALTITLPSLVNSVDRQEILVNTTQTITALTFIGNGSSVVGVPTTLAAGAAFTLRYDIVLKTWYKVG